MRSHVQSGVRCKAALVLMALFMIMPGGVRGSLEGEAYHEEVAFTPIGKSLVLSQFVFRISSSKAEDHVLFPWALHQLQRSVPFQQLNLAMTKGRWDYNSWGSPPPSTATPSGLEVTAAFPSALNLSATHQLWGNLIQALSGMVCASLDGPLAPTLLHPQLHHAVLKPQHTHTTTQHTAQRAGNPQRAGQQGGSGPLDGSGNGGSGNEAVDGSGNGPLDGSGNEAVDGSRNGSLDGSGTDAVDGSGNGPRDRNGVVRVDVNEGLHWLHLLLPQEGVCTENLTPLLKLLPCRGVAGPAALLPIPVLHAAHFYSLQLLTGAPDSPTSTTPATRHLTILVNIVHPASATAANPRPQQSTQQTPQQAPVQSQYLHLSSLFPVEKFPGSCVLAASSSVYVVLPSHMAMRQQAMRSGKKKTKAVINSAAGQSNPDRDPTHVTPAILSLPRTRGLPTTVTNTSTHVDQGFSAVRYDWEEVAAAGKLPDVWLEPETVREATRSQVVAAWKPQMHAVITGPIHGQLVLRLSRGEALGEAEAPEEVSEVCFVQVIPNHMRIWLHSTALTLDGQAASLKSHVPLLHLVPPSRPSDPFGLQLCLSLPAHLKTATLSWRFSKAFKHVFDHPPDAARGLDIAPVMVVTKLQLNGGSSGNARQTEMGRDADTPSDVLWELLTGTPDKVYSETLVTPISTPDFSMPYNVCCLTCTLLAIFFGTTLNTLLLRPGEALAKGKGGRPRRSVRTRIIKMTVAMVLMVVLLYKFDEATREAIDGVLDTFGIQLPEM